MRLVEQRDGDAEGAVGSLRPADGLEDEIDRSAEAHRLHLCGDVAEYAALRGNGEALTGAVDEVKQVDEGAQAVGDRVDADDCIARAEHEAVEDGCGDARGRVGWVVGLQARGESARQADRGAEAGDDGDLASDENEVLQTHELGNRRGHLRREPWSERGEIRRSGVVGEQPVTKSTDGETGDGSEGRRFMRVEDEARDFICLIRDDRLIEEVLEWQIGECHLCGDAFLRGGGADAG